MKGLKKTMDSVSKYLIYTNHTGDVCNVCQVFTPRKKGKHNKNNHL